MPWVIYPRQERVICRLWGKLAPARNSSRIASPSSWHPSWETQPNSCAERSSESSELFIQPKGAETGPSGAHIPGSTWPRCRDPLSRPPPPLKPGPPRRSAFAASFGRSLTLAGTGGGGVDATPPLRFFWNIFFVYRSIVTIFSIAFRPSFLRPP